MIGRLPVEEYGASLNLVVAATFRRCTLGWFGGCSFEALIHGFDSRHRRQDCDSCFMRILEALMLGTMKLEIIARWLLTYQVDPG